MCMYTCIPTFLCTPVNVHDNTVCIICAWCVLKSGFTGKEEVMLLKVGTILL